MLKTNTTQNSSNGMSNEITVLNLIFFNSTVVLISQFAYEGSFFQNLAGRAGGDHAWELGQQV